MRRRWARRLVVAALAVLLVGLAGCGDGDAVVGGDGNPDGVLTAADGSGVRDWGTESEREFVVERLDRMLRDFRAGRMAAVCARVSPLGLGQFTPGGTEPGTPCPAKMAAFASALRARVGDPVEMRVLWVRAYPIVSSVWVALPGGERVRVGFTDLDGSGMRLEVGTFPRRDLLYGMLRGVRGYIGG